MNKDNKNAIITALSNTHQTFPIHYRLISGANTNNATIYKSHNHNTNLTRILLNAFTEDTIQHYTSFNTCLNCQSTLNQMKTEINTNITRIQNNILQLTNQLLS
eukprot:381964_1